MGGNGTRAGVDNLPFCDCSKDLIRRDIGGRKGFMLDFYNDTRYLVPLFLIRRSPSIRIQGNLIYSDTDFTFQFALFIGSQKRVIKLRKDHGWTI